MTPAATDALPTPHFAPPGSRDAQIATRKVYRQVTFDELLQLNGWDPQRRHAPDEKVMLVANELAANIMNAVSDSVRSVALRHGLTSGGHRKRASDYAASIVEVHRSEADRLDVTDLAALLQPAMTAQESAAYLPPLQVQAPPPAPDATILDEALAAAWEAGELADVDDAAAKLERLVVEDWPLAREASSEPSVAGSSVQMPGPCVDVDTLGIRALRELISSAGLSYEDCIEKSELRARAREALEVKKSDTASGRSVVHSSSTLSKKAAVPAHLRPQSRVSIAAGLRDASQCLARIPSLSCGDHSSSAVMRSLSRRMLPPLRRMSVLLRDSSASPSAADSIAIGPPTMRSFSFFWRT